MPQGWSNTNWDTVATGVYRPELEIAQEQQRDRLLDGDAFIGSNSRFSPLSLVVAAAFVLFVTFFIFFPEHLAAIFS